MKDDQHPAFPTLIFKDVVQVMSLHDFFAAAALTGLLADPDRNGTAKDFARDAYTLADEMMKARDQS